jgi:hypothetical protein
MHWPDDQTERSLCTARAKIKRISQTVYANESADVKRM